MKGSPIFSLNANREGKRRLLSGLLLLVLLLTSLPASVRAQADQPPPEVAALMEEMTPEERVGQLFLIHLQGAEIGEEAEIAAFLAAYSVGGVVLRQENDNFLNEPAQVEGVYQLVAGLQKEMHDAARARDEAYIPLFVGLTQEEQQVLSALTPQPSPMALGATWDASFAEENAALLGGELAALGINLYLGPSLGILETPNANNPGDLGAYAFGGNPYWVSEMGKAYIRGLHRGSEGKMLVVAKNFPGSGSADRSSQEEIVTIRKNLEALKNTDLIPFSAVTRFHTAQESADALLIPHIRYEGFQGNISPATRPISLDEKSLNQIISTPPFDEWRTAGGLLVSDDLGSRAIRDFYAPGGQDFLAQLVARDAFLAGNDLLYMGDILSSDAPDNLASVRNTLKFFAEKYREDSAFAARVDESLQRILTHKLRLYPSFSPAAVRPPPLDMEEIGAQPEIAFATAQNAATLLNPGINNLDTVFPSPPLLAERVIFITDTQSIKPCSTCEAVELFPKSALPEAILRLYGVGSGEEILESNLYAYAFDDFLNALVSEEDTLFEANLRQADWVILSLANAESLPTLRNFFNEHQDILREKKTLIFSFTIPYALEATDISKLTAYYGLYSYSPPFVDVAARLLFKELTTSGASPVSVDGIGYDLNTVTRPAPNQLLTLNLALPQEASPTPEAGAATPEPTEIPMFQVGDTLAVRTGMIVDKNGNPVPDNTLVIFSLTTGGDSGSRKEIETGTIGGVARANFQLDETGLLDIRAASGEATVSETLRLDISDEGIAAAVTIIPPSSNGTETPTPVILPSPTPTLSPYLAEGKLRIGAWFLALLLYGVGAAAAYMGGKERISKRWGLRLGLTTFLGGLFAYNYLVWNFPGSAAFTSQGIGAVITFVLLGEALGWLGGWLWMKREE